MVQADKKNTRFVTFDIKITKHMLNLRKASLTMQQAFSKPCVESPIFKGTYLVFSI